MSPQRPPFVARRSRRCWACRERIRPGQRAVRLAQHVYVHERDLDAARAVVAWVAEPSFHAFIAAAAAACQRINESVSLFAHEVASAGTAYDNLTARLASSQGPAFVVCRGCGYAWWDDEDCACTCQAGDDRYEDWAVEGP